MLNKPGTGGLEVVPKFGSGLWSVSTWLTYLDIAQHHCISINVQA